MSAGMFALVTFLGMAATWTLGYWQGYERGKDGTHDDG